MSENEHPERPGDDETPRVTDDGPAIEDLEDDPAYNPSDDELKDLKGG